MAKRKCCGKCGEIKDIDEFYKSSTTKDGLQIWCNECNRKVKKEWRDKNREKVREYFREYKKNHRDKMNEYYVKYYNKNPELFQKIHQEKKKRNDNKCICCGDVINVGYKYCKRCTMLGERSPAWKGGKSFEPYPQEFSKRLKEKVRQIYGYKCVECCIHEKELKTKLDIHHKDYDKNNNEIENLIPLCKSCHSKTNFQREYWMKHFGLKVIKEIKNKEELICHSQVTI